MKKRWLAVAMTAGLLALVGCGSGTSEPLGLDPMKRFREGYEETVAATTVTQTIEVVRGKLAVYEYEKAYERTDDGYAVTATEKRLNKIDADTEEAYTVVEQEGRAEAEQGVVQAGVFADAGNVPWRDTGRDGEHGAWAFAGPCRDGRSSSHDDAWRDGAHRTYGGLPLGGVHGIDRHHVRLRELTECHF